MLQDEVMVPYWVMSGGMCALRPTWSGEGSAADDAYVISEGTPVTVDTPKLFKGHILFLSSSLAVDECAVSFR